MTEPIVLRRIRLGPSHPPTGKTRHLQGCEVLPAPWELRIVKYLDDTGFYLFYCDDTGKEITDTYHDTLEGAMSQAEWEFEVKENEWEVVTPA
jgi:hypothetical protein